MRAKGGVGGTKLRPILDAINQSLGIERKRDMVIQSLIEYLGESREELFHDCQKLDQTLDVNCEHQSEMTSSGKPKLQKLCSTMASVESKPFERNLKEMNQRDDLEL
ncbi:hypothetical protein MHYP_G00241190 [Metynnis hypsauchen]